MDQNKKPERRSRIRFPITLFVDGIEFDPKVEFDDGAVRTSYDLEITEYDMTKLYEWLGDRISRGRHISARIRFIGRLVSQ